MAILNPTWSLSEVRQLPVRERRHWVKWFRAVDAIRKQQSNA